MSSEGVKRLVDYLVDEILKNRNWSEDRVEFRIFRKGESKERCFISQDLFIERWGCKVDIINWLDDDEKIYCHNFDKHIDLGIYLYPDQHERLEKAFSLPCRHDAASRLKGSK